jgi:hypothetical protein
VVTSYEEAVFTFVLWFLSIMQAGVVYNACIISEQCVSRYHLENDKQASILYEFLAA